jgi:hypothetical protein
LWGIFDTVTTTVEGQGVMTRLKGVKTVYAEGAGRVGKIKVRIGDRVPAGAPLIDLLPAQADARQAPAAVTSPTGGRILEVAVDEGELIEAGAPLVIFESLDYRLQAVVFVPLADGYQIKDGAKVEVLPASGRQDSRPYLGRIESAGKVPVTRAAMLQSLQHEGVVDNLLKEGPTLEIIAGLAEELPTEDIYSGTPCRALITIDTMRPIELIFPGRRGS